MDSVERDLLHPRTKAVGFELIPGGRLPIKAWTKGVPVEDAAKQQLINLANMPFLYKHVAVMPDVHFGRGATVGSVIATKGAIIPAAVGVDIGCGMAAQQTTLVASDLPDNLLGLRTEIERLIPHGRTNDGKPGDRGAWHDVPVEYTQDFDFVGLDDIVFKHPKLARPAQRAPHHLGTLGTGNHFVEICLDEQDQVWIMLHSGSRGIGNAIGGYFTGIAKEEMVRQFIELPDKDLAYLLQDTQWFKDYFQALHWAQMFARINRDLMMGAAIKALRILGKEFALETAVNCHHNYVEWEKHFGQDVMVTRKGAVNAEQGVMGIIPGSMGAKSFIVRGKGCREAFNSCSHGAGRAMSRTEAKRRFTVEDHVKATEGVECKKDASVLDETPMAYKDVDAVMRAQEELTEIVHTLRGVVCVKG